MYDILYEIIGHVFETGTSYSSTEQQIYMYGCMSLIIVLTAVFVDLIYRVFRHFWR